MRIWLVLVLIAFSALLTATVARADPPSLGAHRGSFTVTNSTTIFIPASQNPNGIVIKTAVIQTGGAGPADLDVVFSDNTFVEIFGFGALQGAGGQPGSAVLPYPIYVPANVTVEFSAGPQSVLNITWDTL